MFCEIIYYEEKITVGDDQEMVQSERNSQSKTEVRKNLIDNKVLILSRVSSYFPNRWPLSYPNLTKTRKSALRGTYTPGW